MCFPCFFVVFVVILQKKVMETIKERINKKFNIGDYVIVSGSDDKPKFNGNYGIIISICESSCDVYVPGYKEFIKVVGKQAWTSSFTCSTDSLIPYDEWVREHPHKEESKYNFTFEVATVPMEALNAMEGANGMKDLPVEPKLILEDEDYVDWQDYEMELAHDIAVAYAEKGRYEPREIGGYAVLAARSVVQNLKKKKQA